MLIQNKITSTDGKRNKTGQSHIFIRAKGTASEAANDQINTCSCFRIAPIFVFDRVVLASHHFRRPSGFQSSARGHRLPHTLPLVSLYSSCFVFLSLFLDHFRSRTSSFKYHFNRKLAKCSIYSKQYL